MNNSEIQRLNVGLRVDLEKYRNLVIEDPTGNSGQLIQRVEELQDLLI